MLIAKTRCDSDAFLNLYGWPQTFVSATGVSRAGHRE